MTPTLATLIALQIAAPPPAAVEQASSPVQATAPDPAGDDTPGRTGPAATGDGGEIVVTARRRSESVQKVPIAMSVIGGTALAETRSEERRVGKECR